jgi:hypothetical protein
VKYRHDPEADALYITLRPEVPYHVSIVMDDARVVDFGTGPDPIPRGIELLWVSKGVDVRGLPEEAAVAQLLREHGIRITHQSAEVA